jgi:NADPH2:quinone reductase
VPAVRKLDRVCAGIARMWRGTAIVPHRCPPQHRHPGSLSSRIQGNPSETFATKGAMAHDFSTHRSDQTSSRVSRLMQAIEVSATGGPEVLAYVERRVPEPAPGQLLIKAEAIGVNFVDTYFRTGLYPHSLPFILGSEVAGTVAAVGEGVQKAEVGDRVATSDADGAYAEYCLAPAGLVCHVPDGVSAEVAASAILKGQTAHLLIKSVYPVRSGDTVLLHAGAGGVGLILTQWATSLGARVIATASTEAKAELSRQAGAFDVLGYPDDPATFGAKIRALTGGAGVSAVYDGVGRSTFDASLASLAVRGTLALYGASSGPVPPVDPQRLNAAGSVYLTRPLRPHFLRTYDEFAWRTDELFATVQAGKITVTTGDRYPLRDAAQAHRDLEGRKTHGSTVLIP